MAGDILREVEKRIINNFMDFITLLILNNNGSCISGYDVIKYIYKEFSFLASSGTVYSHLYAMERDGWIQGMQKDRCRVYRLTPKGQNVIKEIERTNGNIQRLIARILSVRHVILS